MVLTAKSHPFICLSKLLFETHNINDMSSQSVWFHNFSFFCTIWSLVTLQSSSVCFSMWLCSHHGSNQVNKNCTFLAIRTKIADREFPSTTLHTNSNQKVPKLYSFLFWSWHFLEDLLYNFMMLMALALTTSYPQRPLLLPMFLELDVALMWCQSHFEARIPDGFEVCILFDIFFLDLVLGGFHCFFAKGRGLGGSRLLHSPLLLDLVLGGRNLWYLNSWVTRIWNRLVLGGPWWKATRASLMRFFLSVIFRFSLTVIIRGRLCRGWLFLHILKVILWRDHIRHFFQKLDLWLTHAPGTLYPPCSILGSSQVR